MKDPISRKEKSDRKVEMRCPFFKAYFTGICSGHKLPYAPNETEKKEYCLSAEYRTCAIFGESSYTPEEK